MSFKRDSTVYIIHNLILSTLVLECNESDSDDVSSSSTSSEYSAPSMDDYEEFETDPTSLSFMDQVMNIRNAIKVYCRNNITKLKIKIVTMLNSNAKSHSVPHRRIKKLTSRKCNSVDKIFDYFSCYIKRENPTVLRIMVDASGCSKAKNLYDDYFSAED